MGVGINSHNPSVKDPSRETILMSRLVSDEVRGALIVLVICSSEADFSILSQMLGWPPLNPSRVRTFLEARTVLLQNLVPVVVADSGLADGCRKDVLCAVGSSQHPPRLVIASQLADAHLWAEVLNLGGYDVLSKPFDATEVNRAVDSALRNWIWLNASQTGFIVNNQHVARQSD